MANDMENSVRTAVQKLAQALENATEMKVETRYIIVKADAGAGPEPASQLAASTVVELDGDSVTTVPMRQNQTGLEIDSALLDLHQKNVTTAIEYRTRVLNALLSLVQPRTK